MFWGMSLRATGQGEAVHRLLMDEYESLHGKPDAYTLRILFPVCVNALETGNLEQVRQAAQTLLEQATLGQLAILQGWAHYFLGAVHYHWNELGAAAHHFEQVVHRRYAVHVQAARNSLIGLTRVHLARAELPTAWQSMELLCQLDVERTGQVREDALSLRAQLEVAQGDTARALRWVEAYTAPAPDRLMNWLQDPHLAKAQILLTQDAEVDVQAALDSLRPLDEFAQRACSPGFRIKILALRAVALAAQGKAGGALAALQQAVELARPGGFIRVFVDLGPHMQTLLLRLAEQGYAPEFVNPILAAFPAPHKKIATSRPNSACALQIPGS